jgi:hypothetical protein
MLKKTALAVLAIMVILIIPPKNPEHQNNKQPVTIIKRSEPVCC